MYLSRRKTRSRSSAVAMAPGKSEPRRKRSPVSAVTDDTVAVTVGHGPRNVATRLESGVAGLAGTSVSPSSVKGSDALGPRRAAASPGRFDWQAAMPRERHVTMARWRRRSAGRGRLCWYRPNGQRGRYAPCAAVQCQLGGPRSHAPHTNIRGIFAGTSELQARSALAASESNRGEKRRLSTYAPTRRGGVRMLGA